MERNDKNIVKGILNSIVDYSENENLEHREWLNQNESNLKLQEKFKDSEYLSKSINNFKNFSSKSDWKIVSKKIYGKNISYKKWVSYAASIIIVLGVSLFFFLSNSDEKSNTLFVNHVDFSHGKHKAILLLENGEEVTLNSKEGKVIEYIDGEIFENDGKKLVYESKENEKAKWHTLIVPRGGEYELLLSDGTKVILNSDSKIRYPDIFTGERRKVELIGEAYFEVAKDSLHPFIVKSNNMDIKVLGTTFNLKVYPEEFPQATLINGSISVNCNGFVKELRPGQQASFVDNKLHIRRVDIKPFIAWKDSRFVFENECLEYVLNKLERWYNIHIEVPDERVFEYNFTGNLPKYESIRKVINFIELTAPIKFEINDDKIKVIME